MRHGGTQMSTSFRLYHYWRSSSSWRVRWAFALKKIQCEFVAVDLLTDETEQEPHLKRNPMGFIPVLEFLEPSPLQYLAESIAIIEWAEETYPTPSLFPKTPLMRARARQLAELINGGIQPLQNPTTSQHHSADPEEQKKWNRYWIHRGLNAYETLVKETAGKFSIGDEITLPDLFLVPQCYNALRFEVPLEKFPILKGVYDRAIQTEGYLLSSPELFKP